VAQTIEGFVGNALDNAKISPLHRRIVGLIAAGYFFDVIDFTIFGSMVPFILGSKFATGPEVAAIGSATALARRDYLSCADTWVAAVQALAISRTWRMSVPQQPPRMHRFGRASRSPT